jgi:hypothetical protein
LVIFAVKDEAPHYPAQDVGGAWLLLLLGDHRSGDTSGLYQLPRLMRSQRALGRGGPFQVSTEPNQL